MKVLLYCMSASSHTPLSNAFESLTDFIFTLEYMPPPSDGMYSRVKIRLAQFRPVTWNLKMGDPYVSRNGSVTYGADF